MLRLAIVAAASIGILAGVAEPAFAAANPSGTGQPNQDCESIGTAPAGFATGGFARAEDVYAGSDGSASLAHAHSDKAVSQYDVACYQASQSH